MGRSPGKWIKTILFGKKGSRSNLSKGRNDLKSSNEEALVSTTAPTAGLIAIPPLIPHTEPISNHKNGENSELEQSAVSSSPSDGPVLMQGGDKNENTTPNVSNSSDRLRQEQAATKAQAAFRGYLARRAFRALMGIIRLQALVRGHLVRRQAVATLRCVLVIVKFQALVRGKREDGKSVSCGLHTFVRAEKLFTNSFICKLLASSPNTKPLCLQYGLGEPNSAWSWLERWSNFRVWEPLPQPRKVVDSKGHTRPKRTVRRLPVANIDNGLTRSASEKSKRNMKKVSGRPVDLAQESSQTEFDKVKRNLRKVSNSTNETADHNEAETEKPRRISRKVSGSPAPDVLTTGIGETVETEKSKNIPRKSSGSKSESTDQVEVENQRLKCIPRKSLGVPDNGMVESTDKLKKDTPEPAPKHYEECTQQAMPDNGIIDVLHDDHTAFDSPRMENLGKEENTHVTEGKSTSKEDQASNENHKTSSRRASLPAKQEYPETGLQNTPKLPSYMAATESAKAKLRAQGSPRSGPDVTDQNGLTRRHSLPSSTNGKMSSLSPRTQKPQANSKGVVKQDRSILSSKDGNEKVAQVEWRR